ncbi:MAG: hypothetical protein AAF500_22490 [Myxococcota bacterium]
MRARLAWIVALAGISTATACDGDDTGAIGVGGVGGAGTDVCGILCASPCVSEVQGFPQGGFSDCLDECEDTPVYQVCSRVTIAFVRCIDSNGCGENAAVACMRESIDIGQCLTLPGGEVANP